VDTVRIRELVSGAAAGMVGGLLRHQGDESYLSSTKDRRPRWVLSTPDLAYPLSTDLRGNVGHLADGAAVAATAEILMFERR
jgi:hypothetical protein